MIDFLLGVPGKLKAISDWLTTYWTAARAAKLDLITVAPAPASTALTNATWTDARAAKLDLIAAQASVIQSIGHYSGSVVGGSTLGTASIASVNTAKAIIIMHGQYTDAGTLENTSVGLNFASSTSVNLIRTSTGNTVTVEFSVLEFK